MAGSSHVVEDSAWEADECASEHDGDRNLAYEPNNVCCNAPCPPGSFCNTDCCNKKTQFYVQRWRCVWKQCELACGGDSQHGPPKCKKSTKCAWTKAWTCCFERVPRGKVLEAMCRRQPPRCPDPDGDCDCFVPEDAYFAQVWEIEYEPCVPDEALVMPGEPGYDPCLPQDAHGNPGGCACCGLYQVCVPRWVKINCKNEIPPEDPFAVPLPYYERPCAPRKCRRPPALCGGVSCGVAGNANRSPDFWLRPALPYA